MGQANRAEPHLLTLGSASSLKIMCIKDVTVRENTGVGFFLSSSITEGCSDVSDEYHIKISYRMEFKKKLVIRCVYVHVYVHVCT